MRPGAERPAQGPLRAPRRASHPVTAALERVHEEVAGLRGGAVAGYIPELADADPEPLGLALVSAEGHEYAAGDAHTPFTIQSVSKPFVLALALADLGLEAVLRRVGAEPSGEAFNAISLEPGTGRPANPLVNAGAILTTSLVRGAGEDERFERIRAALSAFAGRPLDVDEAVAASELRTADRNLALAHLMRAAGSLAEDPEATVATYCRACALLVSAADLAAMAATLAAGGVNPVTGVRAAPPDVAEHVLSVMATCGMYDGAGEWLLRVGLPAKSGVAGGLIAVSPAQFGIGLFSPRLDEHGNSVRAVAAARILSERFGLHLMHHPGHRAPVVRSLVREPLPGGAGEALVVAAQGEIEFTGAERLLWEVGAAIEDAGAPPAALVLDLSAVSGLERVAERMLAAAAQEVRGHGIGVAIVEGAADPVLADGVPRTATREAALAALSGRAAPGA